MVAKDLYYAHTLLEAEDLRKRFPNALEGMKVKRRRYLLYFPVYFIKRLVIVFSLIVLRGKHLTIQT